MASVYSKRLVGPVTPAAGFIAVGTVPANKTWVINYVSLINTAGAAFAGDLWTTAGTGLAVLWQQAVGAGGAFYTNAVRIVYAAGETVYARGNGAAVWTLCGFELDA